MLLLCETMQVDPGFNIHATLGYLSMGRLIERLNLHFAERRQTLLRLARLHRRRNLRLGRALFLFRHQRFEIGKLILFRLWLYQRLCGFRDHFHRMRSSGRR